MRFLFVGLGGAIGAMLRYALSLAAITCFGKAYVWGTFTANILGCFCIGLLATLFQNTIQIPTNIKLMILVGLLGGFTTFSTYSWETIGFIKERHYTSAIYYVLASNLMGIAAALCGAWLTGYFKTPPNL